MFDLHPQYVIDEHKKKKAVLLSISEWSEIISKLEELDDIRAYEEAKQSNEKIPFDQAVREIRDHYKS